jgi:predicted RNase H-like HicB family nuclease
MDAIEATAEVFLTAFHALSENEKKLFFEELLKDKEFVEDLTDIAIFDQRKAEPSRSIDEYLANKKKDCNKLTLELEFDPETGEYVSACSELDLASAGDTREEAIDNLLEAMIEYAEDYLDRLDIFVKSPNRSSHLTLILLIASCASKEDILESFNTTL